MKPEPGIDRLPDRQIAAERDDEDAERDERGAGNVIDTKAHCLNPARGRCL